MLNINTSVIPRIWLVIAGVATVSLFVMYCTPTSQVIKYTLKDHEDYTPQSPIVAVSPKEQQKRFVLQPGYHMETVLSEPDIMEPMQIAFDGNGRMFVLEMSTYMKDIDATDELEPRSRISMHEDTNSDGIYDHHSVFIDNMVVPRFVMPFGPNSVLSMESNQDEVWLYTDTNDDGTADEKELFAGNFGRSANIEHQQSSLTWAMDNWLYSTYNAFRIRWTPDGVIRESTGSPGGSWGVTQDSYGKTFVQGGASGVPAYTQFLIRYGNFQWDERFEDGMEVPYGLAGVADYQPGPQASREDGSLNWVTGSAGNDVFRGDRLPEDLIGDYIHGEPVARIVRRLRLDDFEGLEQFRNLYQKEEEEFIRSTDHLFRPVQMATAPDGTLYIADTYRGIIQQGNWTQEGSYLREKILQFQMDKVFNNGRIWRLTHDEFERNKDKPRMNDETPAELVRHLEHPNGWWRDTAQRLLVLQQDQSVVPALEAMVKDSDNLYARFHALWTLEGLYALESDLVLELMGDSSPQMRVQAIRASETLYKAGETSFATIYRDMTNDPDHHVVIQSMLTLNYFQVPDVKNIVESVLRNNEALGVQYIGAQIIEKLETPSGPSFSGMTDAEEQRVKEGMTIYRGLCNSCHGNDGRGVRLSGASSVTQMAPPLAGSEGVVGHRDYVIKTLLHGLESESDIMVSMGINDDEWIAAVASYIRNDFTNKASLVKPEDVARVRADHAGRENAWRHNELYSSLPQLVNPQDSWKITASHNAPVRVGFTANPSGAFSLEGWTTGKPQESGMWFQIELAASVNLSEIEFESPMQRRDGEWGRTSPSKYRLQVSTGGDAWTTISEGQADGTSTTTINFDSVQARYIRITQTAESENAFPWAMQKLKLYESGL
ncbi:MAG: discoidin domain-containing protein [Balneolales bacterium]